MTTGVPPFQTHIRSEMLGELRKIKAMKNFLGHLAQFVVVVDANIILRDLRWLVKKRKNPDATTELMECIMAGTIVAYIARSVLAEVDEHITTIAAKQKLSEDALRQEWKKYRKLVKVRTPRKALVDRYKEGQDPDDAPTIALEKMLRADGILSKDTDILAMGGLVIEMDFTNRARDYSRKTVVAAIIRCSGGITLTVSLASLDVVLKSVASSVAWFRRLPAHVQIILFLAVVAVISNKKAQERVITMIEPIKTAISGHWPDVLRWLASVSTMLVENTVAPPALSYLDPAQRSAAHRRTT